jgi:hypothetical protein
MSSYDTWLNVLTGISRGSFDKIYIRDANGNMVDLLTLLGSIGGGITDVISQSSELVVSTNGSTKILTLNLGGHVTNTALTNALAAYTDTTALTTFLGAKQNTLTAGTGIAISGATISSIHTPITLQLDGTTQSGATTLNFVGNNASFASNVLNISRMAWQDALTLRYSNAASDKNLSQGSAGELLWNGLEVQLRQNAFHQISVVAPLTISGSNSITLDTLWKPSTVTVGTGIQAVASDANGTLQLDLTGTESRSQLKLIDSQNVVRSLVPSVTGALTWNGSALVDLTYLSNSYATSTSMNTSLATKQNTLTNYSETTGTATTIVQTFDDATPISIHVTWGSGAYTNVQNSHQQISIPVYHHFGSLGSGTVYMTVELKAGTCNEAVFSINDSTAWVQVHENKFSNLSTSVWTTFSWQFPIPSNGKINFHIGYIPTGSSLTQAPGTVLLKNLHLYKSTASATISSQLGCSGDLICSRTITATSFASTSDEAIKENVQDASIEDCMEIFQHVDVKTYNRKDVAGQRIGFVAQDIQQYLPPEFANVLGMQYGGDMPLLSLSYDRLVCVLWAVCKSQEQRISALDGRLTSLEAKTTTKKTQL